MFITLLYSSLDSAIQSDECPDICNTYNVCEIIVARQFYRGFDLFICINFT